MNTKSKLIEKSKAQKSSKAKNLKEKIPRKQKGKKKAMKKPETKVVEYHHPGFPKANNKQLLDQATMNNLIERHRSHRIQRGRNERQATEDAMVYLSYHGKKVFEHGIKRMRKRELLSEREDIYFGGRNRVGLGELELCKGYGQIFCLPPAVKRVNQNGYTLYVNSDILKKSARELGRERTGGLVLSTVGSMIRQDEKAFCSICIKPLKGDTQVSVLPCKHWYCTGCIQRWVSSPMNDCCPRCMQLVGGWPPSGRIRAL
ncbi:RING finger protein [Penicillium herquei]|nr:RING finger protein [Penicillium herquei]